MLKRALAWFRGKSARVAVNSVVAHFQATNDLMVHRKLCKVIGMNEYGYVVRVSYGDNKPPRRAWFIVLPNEPAPAELTFDQAQRYGEKSDR